jgi:nucleoside-diphosphate-sugar epimerase
MNTAMTGLTVAVTGPTGTFGFGLIPRLQSDGRIARVVGIARRPFDPGAHGWTKMEYRRGDVRDPGALEEAFAGADVVVHLAFMITGNAARSTIRAINVDGTLNAFRAAAKVKAQRFVYASSVAAYGFHADNPQPLTEEWPVRPAAHLFYAQEKAEIEHALADEAAGHPKLGLYLLRPPIVLGPHAVGAKELLPGPLAPLARRVAGGVRRLPLPLPVLAPALPIQFVHEDDVGQALLLAIVGAGPPGAYNIAGEGVLTGADVAREVGLMPLPPPRRVVRTAARAVAALPFAPPMAEWAEAIARPAIMDSSKARKELGWEPRFSGLEALRDTLARAGE